MELLRSLCLPRLSFLLLSVLTSSSRHQEALQLAQVLASDQHRLYQVSPRFTTCLTVCLSVWPPPVCLTTTYLTVPDHHLSVCRCSLQRIWGGFFRRSESLRWCSSTKTWMRWDTNTHSVHTRYTLIQNINSDTHSNSCIIGSFMIKDLLKCIVSCWTCIQSFNILVNYWYVLI